MSEAGFGRRAAFRLTVCFRAWVLKLGRKGRVVLLSWGIGQVSDA